MRIVLVAIHQLSINNANVDLRRSAMTSSRDANDEQVEQKSRFAR